LTCLTVWADIVRFEFVAVQREAVTSLAAEAAMTGQRVGVAGVAWRLRTRTLDWNRRLGRYRSWRAQVDRALAT
jgi:hypothetical protein